MCCYIVGPTPKIILSLFVLATLFCLCAFVVLLQYNEFLGVHFCRVVQHPTMMFACIMNITCVCSLAGVCTQNLNYGNFQRTRQYYSIVNWGQSCIIISIQTIGSNVAYIWPKFGKSSVWDWCFVHELFFAH